MIALRTVFGVNAAEGGVALSTTTRSPLAAARSCSAVASRERRSPSTDRSDAPFDPFRSSICFWSEAIRVVMPARCSSTRRFTKAATREFDHSAAALALPAGR